MTTENHDARGKSGARSHHGPRPARHAVARGGEGGGPRTFQTGGARSSRPTQRRYPVSARSQAPDKRRVTALALAPSGPGRAPTTVRDPAPFRAVRSGRPVRPSRRVRSPRPLPPRGRRTGDHPAPRIHRAGRPCPTRRPGRAARSRPPSTTTDPMGPRPSRSRWRTARNETTARAVTVASSASPAPSSAPPSTTISLRPRPQPSSRPMRRTVAYARTSSGRQSDNTSIPDQIAVCRARAAHHGARVVAEFSNEAISAKRQDGLLESFGGAPAGPRSSPSSRPSTRPGGRST